MPAAAPLSPKDALFTDGVDDYLNRHLSEILPKAKELVKGERYNWDAEQNIRQERRVEDNGID